MKIAKQDALRWFTFFADVQQEEELPSMQQEIAYATLAQIEEAVEAAHTRMLGEIPQLKTLCDRTYYVGPDDRFPQGCRSCLLGNGLSAIRKTNRCNIQCKFCYNYGELNRQPPIGEGLWEIGGTRFYERDMDLLFSVYPAPTGVAYVYLEPFMEIEKYYGMIRRFRDKGVHQHLYTNGLLATEDNLRQLGEAGLDELRFNLGASNCADSVLQAMRLAKRYIPQVGIETPMTPEFYAQFHEKKGQILATGLDFLNCAELHLNPNNLPNYLGEEMYMSRLGYLSPIWSRTLTLQLMREAAQEGWNLVVHDCANRTKFARDLHLRAREGGWFGASSYASEFPVLPYEAFLPTLRNPNFHFLQEEPLPAGFGVGDIVL